LLRPGKRSLPQNSLKAGSRQLPVLRIRVRCSFMNEQNRAWLVRYVALLRRLGLLD
jgi:hypothetical protein